MKKGFSGSSPQPVQLELAIERTFSMLYLLTIEAGFPLNNLTLPTKRCTTYSPAGPASATSSNDYERV